MNSWLLWVAVAILFAWASGLQSKNDKQTEQIKQLQEAIAGPEGYDGKPWLKKGGR